MIAALIIILIVGVVLAKFTSNPKALRFFLINMGVMIFYNAIVWGTVIEFYSEGEAGVLPIFWVVLITCIHLALLFVFTVFTAVRSAVKEQSKL